MPANLNTLVRYKTLDRCLSNPYRKWTIGDLTEACAAALKEHRGVYTTISERTIREDIRVMRSDMLGFNAPIIQKHGNYAYEDRSYSIFKVSIKDSELLTRVLEFILEIRSETKHPKLEEIIELITGAISETTPAEDEDELDTTSFPLSSFLLSEPDEYAFEEKLIRLEPKGKLKWSAILDLINS
jgi:hypothetical protein